jgi:hypothetical protein
LPAEPFESTETASVRVDSKPLVTVRQNRYSVPVALAGLRVSAAVGAREVVISPESRRAEGAAARRSLPRRSSPTRPEPGVDLGEAE